jgi:hypothetical protein
MANFLSSSVRTSRLLTEWDRFISKCLTECCLCCSFWNFVAYDEYYCDVLRKCVDRSSLKVKVIRWIVLSRHFLCY